MRSSVAVVFLLAASALHAQQSPELVRLDVVVESRRSAKPLTAADFTVSEAGQSVVVESARLIQPSTETAPLPDIASDEDEKAVAASANRLVGIYLDEYHLGNDAGLSAARAAVAAFVRAELGPRDLVVVLKPLDSLLSIRLTGDRERAAQIVDGAVGRQGDYTPRSTFEQNFIAGAPAHVESARNQIALAAVSALASHLGRFGAGRATLIVVSNGIAGRAQSRGDQAQPGLEGIVRAANRARVAIYAIRPSTLAAAQAQDDAAGRSAAPGDLLAALAEQTTGFVVDGTDGWVSGLQRVLRDASRYYVLTLAPAERAADGRFRSVSVAVREPAGAVRARAGYAVRGEDAAAVPRVSSLPAGLKIPRHTSPLIRTWFGQAAAGDDRTGVQFVWEPAPRIPGERGPAVTPARVSIAVTTMDLAPVFSGVTMPSGRGSVVVSVERPQLQFDAAPGTFLVQMDVLDAAGRVIDHDVRDLVVAAFRGPLKFGSAAVYRARTARELREILDGDAATAPVASRQFSRSEQLVVRVPVISRDGEPTVTVRLQSRFGAAMRDLPVTRVGTMKDAVQVELPLAALASGGYMIEFAAHSATSAVTDRLEFVVTP
jgi:VWFA-related protein